MGIQKAIAAVLSGLVGVLAYFGLDVNPELVVGLSPIVAGIIVYFSPKNS